MNRVYHIYNEFIKFANDHPSVDISAFSIMGWVNYRLIEIEATGRFSVLILTGIAIIARLVFMYKEDKRKSKELKLKEMEREQEAWEFKKRNNLN